MITIIFVGSTNGCLSLLGLWVIIYLSIYIIYNKMEFLKSRVCPMVYLLGIFIKLILFGLCFSVYDILM